MTTEKEDVTDIAIDINVREWKIPEARAYRKHVKVNPEFAAGAIDAAIEAAQVEAREKFGDAVDEDGWDAPDDWVPASLLNIEPDYLLGFAWIPARRESPGLAYDAFSDSLSYGDLLAGFWTALRALVEEATAPLAAKSGRPSRTASGSATPTTGRSKTSTSSRSASSRRQSAS